MLQVSPIPKDPDSVESECYNPHKEARKNKSGVDNPAFRWEKFKTLVLKESVLNEKVATFRDESVTIEERRDRPSSGSDVEIEVGGHAKVPEPDERILLLHFQRPVER